MKTRIFFSGTLPSNSPLQSFCTANGWRLTAQSLLSFETLPFKVERPFEVIFFSSPRSFNYFISQSEITGTAKIACIGSGTTEKINSIISSIDFIGKNSGNPESVAAEFRDWLGERSVLFPLALHSNETIAKAIPENQKEIVRCYQTNLLGLSIDEQDVYVFISPSNVEAFLLKNTLPAAAKIIAWGKTTANKLIQKGLNPAVILEESSEKRLVEELRKLT